MKRISKIRPAVIILLYQDEYQIQTAHSLAFAIRSSSAALKSFNKFFTPDVEGFSDDTVTIFSPLCMRIIM